jgi:hypothetical protein
MACGGDVLEGRGRERAYGALVRKGRECVWRRWWYVVAGRGGAAV